MGKHYPNKYKNAIEEIRRLNKKIKEQEKEIYFLKKSSGILRKGNRLEVYRFIVITTII